MSYSPLLALKKGYTCVYCRKPILDGEQVVACLYTVAYVHPDDNFADHDIHEGDVSIALDWTDDFVAHKLCFDYYMRDED